MGKVVVAGLTSGLAERVEVLLTVGGHELAGTTAASEQPGAVLAAVRTDLDGAANAPGPEALVVVSSALVYGAWPDNPVPLAEDAPLRPNPGFFPAAERAEAERLAAEWAAAHPDVPVAVLRPAVTVGAGWTPLERAITGMGVPRAAEFSRPVQFVHVDDVATAVAFAAEHGLRGVYNVAPDGFIAEETMGELVGGVTRISLPRRAVRLITAAARRMSGRHLRAEALPYGLHAWVVTSDRLRSAGWMPRYTSEEALVETTVASRWESLSPDRRQQVVLGAAAGGVATVAGAVVAAVVAVRRRGAGARRRVSRWGGSRG